MTITVDLEELLQVAVDAMSETDAMSDEANHDVCILLIACKAPSYPGEKVEIRTKSNVQSAGNRIVILQAVIDMASRLDKH